MTSEELDRVDDLLARGQRSERAFDDPDYAYRLYSTCVELLAEVRHLLGEDDEGEVDPWE